MCSLGLFNLQLYSPWHPQQMGCCDRGGEVVWQGVRGVRTSCMTTSYVACRAVLMPGHVIGRRCVTWTQKTSAGLTSHTASPWKKRLRFHQIWCEHSFTRLIMKQGCFFFFKWSNKSLLRLSEELLHVCIPSLISRLLAGMCGMFPWSKRYPDCPPTWLSWERVSHDPKWDKLWMREDWLSGGRQSPQFI